MAETVAPSVQPFLRALHEEEPRWLLGSQFWLRATAAQTGGILGVIEQLTPPGHGSPYHVHHNEDEQFYVLEGEIRFFSEGNSWVLGPGGFAFLPRDIPHSIRTEGDTPSRSLLMATLGNFIGFFAETSSPDPPAGPPDMGALMEAASRYGLEFIGPLPE